MKEYLPITILLLALICVICLMIDSQPNKKIEKKPTQRKTEIIAQPKVKTDNSLASRQKGKTLFNNYCAACHNKNMKDDLTGPALSGTVERWGNDTLKILNYLKNPDIYFRNNPSKRMIDLHKSYGKVPKPSMELLTLEQVKAMLEYIEMDYYIIN